MKHRIIKYITIGISVLFLLLVFFIIIALTRGDNIDNDATDSQIKIESDVSYDETVPNDDDNVNNSNSQLDSDHLNQDNSNDTSNNDNNENDKNGDDAENTEQNDFVPWHPNPDRIVVNWSEFQFPKTKMQSIIDQITRANTILKQKTGEDIFVTKTEDLSSIGLVTYISEHGKHNLFPQNINIDGGRQYVFYPDDVLFGFAFLFEAMYDEKDMPGRASSPDIFRDSTTKNTYYFYPETDPPVVDTFEFISCVENTESEIEMYVKGLGKYSGSNFILTVKEQIDNLWVVHSLEKAP